LLPLLFLVILTLYQGNITSRYNMENLEQIVNNSSSNNNGSNIERHAYYRQEKK
jgi:hypothetical protein